MCWCRHFSVVRAQAAFVSASRAAASAPHKVPVDFDLTNSDCPCPLAFDEEPTEGTASMPDVSVAAPPLLQEVSAPCVGALARPGDIPSRAVLNVAVCSHDQCSGRYDKDVCGHAARDSAQGDDEAGHSSDADVVGQPVLPVFWCGDSVGPKVAAPRLSPSGRPIELRLVSNGCHCVLAGGPERVCDFW